MNATFPLVSKFDQNHRNATSCARQLSPKLLKGFTNFITIVNIKKKCECIKKVCLFITSSSTVQAARGEHASAFSIFLLFALKKPAPATQAIKQGKSKLNVLSVINVIGS